MLRATQVTAIYIHYGKGIQYSLVMAIKKMTKM